MTRGRSPAPVSGRGRSHSPKPHQDKSVPAPPAVKIKGPPNLMDHGYGNLPLALIPEHDDDDDFLKAVQRCIPSEFVLIASQDDVSKAQEDHYAMEHFQLTPPDGRHRWTNAELAGSVATCALLQLMYENPRAMVAPSSSPDENEKAAPVKPWSTLDILQEIQTRIKTCTGQDANPTSSSSRPIGPPRYDEGTYAPYYIVPPNHTQGTRRALLIGIVSGGENILKGTLNDVYNIRRFLVDHCGFLEENIVTLLEKPGQDQPTKKNITDGFAKLIRESQPGDVNFIQFSGHGSRSETNLYIIPCDFQQTGYIMDDKILKHLIKAMPAGVYTTMLVDCCYSGTVCDLPYILKPTSTEQEIEKHFRTSIKVVKHKTTKAPPPKRRLTTRQSVQSFYNLDTLSETLEKEAKGGEEYKQMERARKQKQSWMHFEPKKLMTWDNNVHAAKSMASKTKKGFFRGLGAVGQAAHDATEMAIEATAQASDKVIDVTKKTTAKIRGREMDESSGTTTRERVRSKSPVPDKTGKATPSAAGKDRSRPRSLAPAPRKRDPDISSPNARSRARPRSLAPASRKKDEETASPTTKGRERLRSKTPVQNRDSDEKPKPSEKIMSKQRSKSPRLVRLGKRQDDCPAPVSAASTVKPSPLATTNQGNLDGSDMLSTIKPPVGGTKKQVSASARFRVVGKEHEGAALRDFEKAAALAANEKADQKKKKKELHLDSSTVAPPAEEPQYDWKHHLKHNGSAKSKSPTRRTKSYNSSSKARSKSPPRRF